MSVKIPYMNTGALQKSDSSFIDLLRNRVCPNFQFLSISTILIGACLGIFIFSRIVYPPGGYQQFLQHPTQLDDWLLNIQKFRSDKSYFYELVTAMFLHQGYKHIILNVIFAIFIMYQLQFCWRWSILLALVGGFAANCLAVAAIQGKLLGFSGVLCACIGIQFAALIVHCSYLRQTHGNQFYLTMFMTVLMLLMVISFSSSGLVHFFGLCYGILFGLGFYPKMEEASVNENLDKIFKIMSVAFLGLAVLLAMIA